MKASINYVIASWSGKRRIRYNPPSPDWYLRKHFEYLCNTPHELSQITLVIARNPEEPREYREFVNNLPEYINNTQLSILERPNIGYSYGSYSDAYKLTRDRFDYYIFIEDDYAFVQPHFDKILLDKLAGMPRCGFLCGLVAPWPTKTGPKPHAAIYIGLARSEALEVTWLRNNKLSHPGPEAINYCKSGEAQLDSSHDFLYSRYELRDWTDDWATCFAQEDGSVIWRSSKNGSELPLVMPLNHHILEGFSTCVQNI